MNNLEHVINILKEYDVKGIYFDNELEYFDEFWETFKSMNIRKLFEEAGGQTFNFLLGTGALHKVSMKSLEQQEEELLFQ